MLDPLGLTLADIAQITRYLDVHAEPTTADLGFVFGTRLREPADLAAQVFQRGIVPHIALTGGNNRLTGVNEAHAHLDILLAAGIPRDRIIVEDASTNTLENVVLALPKIAAQMDVAQLKSIVVIAKWYHCRRAMMTLKRHMPSGIRYYPWSYEPPGFPRANWEEHEASREQVLGNWEAIPRYLARGHLAEVERDGDAFV